MPRFWKLLLAAILLALLLPTAASAARYRTRRGGWGRGYGYTYPYRHRPHFSYGFSYGYSYWGDFGYYSRPRLYYRYCPPVVGLKRPVIRDHNDDEPRPRHGRDEFGRRH